MTLASAIAALNPSIWYRLDETSGTNAHNSGSQSNEGTYSGSIAQGQPGPEGGTFATRLYVGGQVISHQMDLSSNVDQTLALMVSMDASGLNNTQYPIVTIGDPGNRLTRGPIIFEQHSTQGTPFYIGGYDGYNRQSIATPEPIRFWHWIALTFHNAANGFIFYVDGVASAPLTATGTPNLQLTDPLLIRCDEPIMVAHVCWWGGILTQTQLQSVSNQLAQWPYTQPINTPFPSSGGGGGLTPDQATQLSDVHGWSANIPGLVDASNFISSTVNTILGKVNQIKDDTTQLLANGVAGVESIITAVSATITDAGGAATRTIGQLLSGTWQSQFAPEEVGTVCFPSVIDHTFGVSVRFGLQMNCTSYADWYVFTGDADDYTTQSLGTLQIFRGGHEVYRRGLHTLTWMVYPLPGAPVFPLNVGVEVTPADFRVVLTPAPETCWHLEALVQP